MVARRHPGTGPGASGRRGQQAATSSYRPSPAPARLRAGQRPPRYAAPRRTSGRADTGTGLADHVATRGAAARAAAASPAGPAPRPAGGAALLPVCAARTGRYSRWLQPVVAGRPPQGGCLRRAYRPVPRRSPPASVAGGPGGCLAVPAGWPPWPTCWGREAWPPGHASGWRPVPEGWHRAQAEAGPRLCRPQPALPQ